MYFFFGNPCLLALSLRLAGMSISSLHCNYDTAVGLEREERGGKHAS